MWWRRRWTETPRRAGLPRRRRALSQKAGRRRGTTAPDADVRVITRRGSGRLRISGAGRHISRRRRVWFRCEASAMTTFLVNTTEITQGSKRTSTKRYSFSCRSTTNLVEGHVLHAGTVRRCRPASCTRDCSTAARPYYRWRRAVEFLKRGSAPAHACDASIRCRLPGAPGETSARRFRSAPTARPRPRRPPVRVQRPPPAMATKPTMPRMALYQPMMKDPTL